MADVIVTKVGCVIIQGRACSEVELTDVYSHLSILKEKMVRANHEADDFVYKDLQPAVLLPRGFTGLIVSRYEDEILCSNHSFHLDTSGLLLFLKVNSAIFNLSFRVIPLNFLLFFWVSCACSLFGIQSCHGSDYFPSESFDRNHQILVSFQFQASGMMCQENPPRKSSFSFPPPKLQTLKRLLTPFQEQSRDSAILCLGTCCCGKSCVKKSKVMMTCSSCLSLKLTGICRLNSCSSYTGK